MQDFKALLCKRAIDEQATCCEEDAEDLQGNEEDGEVIVAIAGTASIRKTEDLVWSP